MHVVAEQAELNKHKLGLSALLQVTADNEIRETINPNEEKRDIQRVIIPCFKLFVYPNRTTITINGAKLKKL